jgi:hypothetical protein
MNGPPAIVALLTCLTTTVACNGSVDDREVPSSGGWNTDHRVIYLWFADGTAPPTRDDLCHGARPPPYSCSLAGSRTECQAAVQGYLDRWYASFGVRFTSVAPPESVAHDTVVISTDGRWCGSVPAGLAQSTCDPLPSGTAWAFACGESAEQCAAIVAQEQAHLLGLEHTDSPLDLMFNPVCRDCVGFENRPNRVVSGRCRSIQNSFALMTERLRPSAQNSEP